MDRIYAGIVTFNPDIERLKQNINAISIQVDQVVVFDNGSDNQEKVADAIPTVIIIKSARLTFFKAIIANGTNMIKETSFVMKTELKKQTKTSIETSPRVFPIFESNFRTNISKTARFFKISTITIITKSKIIVSQLI